MSDDNDDWSEKTDLTRIEDLSEFLHEEDPELDEKLEQSEDSEEVKKEEGGDTEEVEDFFSQNDEEDDQGSDVKSKRVCYNVTSSNAAQRRYLDRQSVCVRAQFSEAPAVDETDCVSAPYRHFLPWVNM